MKSEIEKRAQIIKKMAEKYSLSLIKLQPAFNEACKLAPDVYWTWDGVHPTYCGHEIIKSLWLKAFKNMI